MRFRENCGRDASYAINRHTYCVFIHIYFELVTFALIAVLVIYERSRLGPRVPDRKVTVRRVLKALAEFEPRRRPRPQRGYSEKSVQEQLLAYLSDRFETVVPEYGVGGHRATRIDFDIGGGRVGIEVKLARSLKKSTEFHRLSGQLENYREHRYGDDNLVVAVFGEREHAENRALLRRIREKIEEKSAVFVFGEIGMG